MFGKKKNSFDVTPNSPVFNAKFIGSTQVYIASGSGCTRVPVQTIWDNSKEELQMMRVEVTIGAHGILVRDPEGKKTQAKMFPIENISFCSADKDTNVRVFAWISKAHDTDRLDCYAVLCTSMEKSRAMAVVLSHSFQVAYKDWKAVKKRDERQKSHKPQNPGPDNVELNTISGHVTSSSEINDLNKDTLGDGNSSDVETVSNPDNTTIMDVDQMEMYQSDGKIIECLTGDSSVLQ